MAARLIGSYPSATVHDPKTYTAELVRTLLEFTIRASESGIAQAMADSPSFLPSVPAIRKACNEAKLDTISAEWERRSAAQLAAREALERADKEESPEHRRAVVERVWPRALEGAQPSREISDKLGFRRYTDEELLAIYGKAKR